MFYRLYPKKGTFYAKERTFYAKTRTFYGLHLWTGNHMYIWLSRISGFSSVKIPIPH